MSRLALHKIVSELASVDNTVSCYDVTLALFTVVRPLAVVDLTF